MGERLRLFEPEDTPKQFRVGLRMIKTAAAVFICALIGYARGEIALFSMIAAVICMQPSTEKTLAMSFNQMLGTVIGGAFGVGVCYLVEVTPLADMPSLHYLTLSVLLIPIIMLTLFIKKPSISAFSCIVFIGVAVVQNPDATPLFSSLQRLLDTSIGVAVATVFNLMIPNRYRENDVESQSASDADAPADAAQPNDNREES